MTPAIPLSARSASPPSALDLEHAARFFEYTAACNPDLPAIPFAVFPPALHQALGTRAVPLDLSTALHTDGPATSPALMAHFLRIEPGEKLVTSAVASSQLFYVLDGAGQSAGLGADATVLPATAWDAGALLTVPGGCRIEHMASGSRTAVLYWVTDAPLLRLLGCVPATAQFRPALYSSARMRGELAAVRAQPGAESRNRIGVLLGNVDTPDTLTLTPILWSLLNVIPPGVLQKPHRHNSVALDLCVSTQPGVYTLMGPELTSAGTVKDPVRAYWVTGGMFTTPPGWWHSHHNDSAADAQVLPIQDAGLHITLRTLDIQFVR